MLDFLFKNSKLRSWLGWLQKREERVLKISRNSKVWQKWREKTDDLISSVLFAFLLWEYQLKLKLIKKTEKYNQVGKLVPNFRA